MIPCKRCNGRGYLTEDPMPDCPAVGGYEEHECPACEGSGEVEEESGDKWAPDVERILGGSQADYAAAGQRMIDAMASGQPMPPVKEALTAVQAPAPLAPGTLLLLPGGLLGRLVRLAEGGVVVDRYHVSAASEGWRLMSGIEGRPLPAGDVREHAYYQRAMRRRDDVAT